MPDRDSAKYLFETEIPNPLDSSKKPWNVAVDTDDAHHIVITNPNNRLVAIAPLDAVMQKLEVPCRKTVAPLETLPLSIDIIASAVLAAEGIYYEPSKELDMTSVDELASQHPATVKPTLDEFDITTIQWRDVENPYRQ